MLPHLILVMDHRAPNSISLSLAFSLCLSLGLHFLEACGLCTGAEPDPWNVPGKGLAGDLAAPKWWCKEKSTGLEAGDRKFHPNWVCLGAGWQFSS